MLIPLRATIIPRVFTRLTKMGVKLSKKRHEVDLKELSDPWLILIASGFLL